MLEIGGREWKGGGRKGKERDRKKQGEREEGGEGMLLEVLKRFCFTTKNLMCLADLKRLFNGFGASKSHGRCLCKGNRVLPLQ